MLGITLACVVGGVVVWRLLAPGGRMEVRLIFIGYTNTPLVTQPASWPSGSVTLELPEALLCATNTGSVPVKLWSAILTNTMQFALPARRGLPAVLRPGESVTVSVPYMMTGHSWQTELMYQRHNFADRLYGKAWNTGNRTVQDLIQSLFDAPKVGWAQSGWITNAPPLFAASRFQPSESFWIRASKHTGVPAALEHNIERRPVLRPSDFMDFIDASRPPGRYHITAPPNWRDVDLSDLARGPKL